MGPVSRLLIDFLQGEFALSKSTAPVPEAIPEATPSAIVISDSTSRFSRGPFSALVKYPILRRLWLGTLAASLGQWMQAVALAWLALALTNSPFYVGLVGFVSGVPFLIVSIPAGVLIDKYERRMVLMVGQVAAAVLAVIVSVDVISGYVEPWHLLVAGFLNGSIQAILTPTQQAMVPNLVEREDLTRAVGLMSAAANMTRVVGPTIAGAVIGLAGTGPTFLLQAAAMLLALYLIWQTTFPLNLRISAVKPSAVFEGLSIIFKRADLRALFLLACVPTFFAFPYIQFLSVYARDILDIGASGLGLLMASSGMGAVVGSLFVAARQADSRNGVKLVIATVAYALVLIVIALSTNLFLTLPLLFLAGFLGATYMAMNNAMLQSRISDEYRGRVMGTYVLTWGLMPLGAMPMGIMADHFGTPTAVASGAIVTCILATVIGITTPAIREI